MNKNILLEKILDYQKLGYSITKHYNYDSTYEELFIEYKLLQTIEMRNNMKNLLKNGIMMLKIIDNKNINTNIYNKLLKNIDDGIFDNQIDDINNKYSDNKEHTEMKLLLEMINSITKN
jgi:hypothetical protein